MTLVLRVVMMMPGSNEPPFVCPIVTKSPPQENPSLLAISSVNGSSFAATAEPAVRTRTAIKPAVVWVMSWLGRRANI